MTFSSTPGTGDDRRRTPMRSKTGPALMRFDSYETRADESLLQLGRRRYLDSGDSRRLLITEASAAIAFIAAGVGLAVFGSSDRSVSVSALVVTVVAYLAAERVRYPVGSAWTAP